MASVVLFRALNRQRQKMSSSTDNLHNVKKAALIKIISLQIGLTLILAFEAIGIIFISPAGLVLSYLLLIFYICSNFGITAFCILILAIYSPIHSFQQFFARQDDEKSQLSHLEKSNHSNEKTHHNSVDIRQKHYEEQQQELQEVNTSKDQLQQV